MINWFLYVSLFLVLISYISSLRAFRLDMPAIFKQFSFFLLFTLLAELFGFAWSRWIYKYTPFNNYNQWFYIIYHFVSYLFYLYFFYKVLRLPNIKIIIKILAALYIVFSVINYLFIQGRIELNSHSDLFAAFIMVFCTIAYYYQLLSTREVVSIKHDMVFWISTGIFIYHLGSITGKLLINLMYKVHPEKAVHIHLIIWIAAMFMYLTFLIAYLCHRKK